MKKEFLFDVRMIFVSFFLMVFVLFLSANAMAAIGVSPPKYDVDFIPNSKTVVTFNFFGDDGIPMKISAQGELAKYVEISDDKLKGPGKVNILLKMPDSISTPGNNQILILAEQYSEEGQGFGILGGMRAVINIKVPYPGKYASIELNAADANAGQPVPYTFKVYSLGEERVIITSYLEIYDYENSKIDKINFGSHIVESNEMRDFSGEINTSKYKPGFYKIKAVVDYDDKTAAAETKFRLGELFVNINNYTSIFKRDIINRFDIEVESFWNDPINNTFASVDIINHSTNLLTPTITLGRFQKTILTGYLDTKDIPEDKFYANITVYYGGKSNEKFVELRFGKPIDAATIAIIAAVLLVIFIIGYFFIKRRNFDGGRKKYGR